MSYDNDSDAVQDGELKASWPASAADYTVVLVDNREQTGRDVSMIPGAISAQSFESDIEKYADATVVVYCTIGQGQ